ncbi:golgin subfamily A member 6-like protein 22 [Cardiocondyla obscurior]
MNEKVLEGKGKGKHMQQEGWMEIIKELRTGFGVMAKELKDTAECNVEIKKCLVEIVEGCERDKEMFKKRIVDMEKKIKEYENRIEKFGKEKEEMEKEKERIRKKVEEVERRMKGWDGKIERIGKERGEKEKETMRLKKKMEEVENRMKNWEEILERAGKVRGEKEEGTEVKDKRLDEVKIGKDSGIEERLKTLELDKKKIKRDWEEKEKEIEEKKKENEKEKEIVKKRFEEIEKTMNGWEEKLEKAGKVKDENKAEIEEKKESFIEDNIGKESGLVERVMSLELDRERKDREVRKKNIIIKGVKIMEGRKEVWRRNVEEIIKMTGAEVKVGEVRKIGAINKEGMGMVVVKFESIKEKLEVFKGKVKLRNRKEWIQDDLTVKERKAEWIIRAEAERLRRAGKMVKKGYMKLWIENKIWVWDEVREELREWKGMRKERWEEQVIKENEVKRKRFGLSEIGKRL